MAGAGWLVLAARSTSDSLKRCIRNLLQLHLPPSAGGVKHDGCCGHILRMGRPKPSAPPCPHAMPSWQAWCPASHCMPTCPNPTPHARARTHTFCPGGAALRLPAPPPPPFSPPAGRAPQTAACSSRPATTCTCTSTTSRAAASSSHSQVRARARGRDGAWLQCTRNVGVHEPAMAGGGHRAGRLACSLSCRVCTGQGQCSCSHAGVSGTRWLRARKGSRCLLAWLPACLPGAPPPVAAWPSPLQVWRLHMHVCVCVVCTRLRCLFLLEGGEGEGGRGAGAGAAGAQAQAPHTHTYTPQLPTSHPTP